MQSNHLETQHIFNNKHERHIEYKRLNKQYVKTHNTLHLTSTSKHVKRHIKCKRHIIVKYNSMTVHFSN